MPASVRQLPRSSNSRRRARRGNTLTFSLAALVAISLVGFAGWWLFGRGRGETGPELILTSVSNGPYDFVVIEQGQVESATNIELKCQVKSRGGGGDSGGRGGGGGGGITIISVVPEGTLVEPGDILVELDSSALEQEKVTQLIQVTSQQSLLTQAQNKLAAARIARKEYELGIFVQERKLVEGEVFVAEQGLRTAQLGLDSARILASKGIIMGLQVETAQFNVDNAKKQLEAAQTKLKTLDDYTKDKMLKTFDSDIATAEADVSAQQSKLALEETKLKEIEDQIAKCTIRAPAAGQVVYANEYDSHWGNTEAEFVVMAGAAVRERQAIIRLPNSSDMQVRATVNEARVTLVRPGLPVTIRVDALKDQMIRGEVTKVDPYAAPGGYSSGNVRRYATYIKIFDPPPELRSGMNAEVRIFVERKQEALQIPVQALAEHKGRFFSLVQTATGGYETREIKISSTNDKVATIDSGLVEGDHVVMNPRGAGGLLELPALPDPTTPANLGNIARSSGAPAVTLASGQPGGEGAKRGDGGKRGGKGGKGRRGGPADLGQGGAPDASAVLPAGGGE